MTSREFTVVETRRHTVVVEDAPKDDGEWDALKDELITTDAWREYSIEDQFDSAVED